MNPANISEIPMTGVPAPAGAASQNTPPAVTATAQQNPVPAPAPAQPAPQPAPAANQPDPAQAAVEAAGLDYAALEQEYATNGQLTQETYTKVKTALEKIGIPEAAISNYFQGVAASQQLFMNSVYQQTGGEENYQAMAAWARESLSPTELKAFSDMAETGDAEKALFAVKMLYGQYQNATRQGGQLLQASSSSSSPTGVFKSMDEYVAALADPRHKADPGYRDQVRAKLERSVEAGTFRGF